MGDEFTLWERVRWRMALFPVALASRVLGVRRNEDFDVMHFARGVEIFDPRTGVTRRVVSGVRARVARMLVD